MSFPKFDTQYIWFLQKHNRYTPISGDIWNVLAKVFYKKITHRDDFQSSDGRLDKNKNRFSLRL